MYKDILLALLKLCVVMLIVYVLKDLTKKDHVYNSYYEILGLQYYFGSTAITGCIGEIKQIITSCFMETEDEVKLSKIIKKIHKDMYFYSTIFNNLDIVTYLIKKQKGQKKSFEDTIITTIFNDIEFLMVLSDKNTYVLESSVLINKIKLIDNCISYYGSAKQSIKNNAIMPFLQNMARNDDDNEAIISPIFLCGNPGTGKTKFVEDLANTLDVNVVTLSNSKEFGWYDCTKGIERNKVSDFTDGIYKSKKKYGHDYMIIFIDEIDKKLFKIMEGKVVPDFTFLEYLLSLFNGEKKIYDPYFRDDICVKNTLFICASNMSLEKLSLCHKSFEPLSGRMTEIPIPDMDRDTKLKILRERMMAKTSTTDEKFIETLVDKVKDSGVRKLIKKLDMYTNRINSANIFLGSIWYESDLTIYKNEIINDAIEEATEEKTRANLEVGVFS